MSKWYCDFCRTFASEMSVVHSRLTGYEHSTCHRPLRKVEEPTPTRPPVAESGTPRTDEVVMNVNGACGVYEVVQAWFARDLERALQAAERERDAQWTVLKLLFERFPDCQAMGDLPGCVDELKAAALSALADIAYSKDMTLEVARNKAARIYQELKG